MKTKRGFSTPTKTASKKPTSYGTASDTMKVKGKKATKMAIPFPVKGRYPKK